MLHSFTAEEADELSISAGDRVLLYRNLGGTAEGWVRARRLLSAPGAPPEEGLVSPCPCPWAMCILYVLAARGMNTRNSRLV